MIRADGWSSVITSGASCEDRDPGSTGWVWTFLLNALRAYEKFYAKGNMTAKTSVENKDHTVLTLKCFTGLGFLLFETDYVDQTGLKLKIFRD